MTPFTDIFDLFMMLIKDYRLISLYVTSVDDFNTYLEGWLLHSINDFSNCNQSLIYTTIQIIDNGDGTTTEISIPISFEENLTQENKLILANLMTKYWLQKEIQDVTQMNLHVLDKDFRVYSEAQNLKEKRDLYNSKREELSQLLIDYGYRNYFDNLNQINLGL